MDDLQKLLAIEEIRNLKARYIMGVDRPDRDMLRSTFADDVVADYSATIGTGTAGQLPDGVEPDVTMAMFKGGDATADAIAHAYDGMGVRSYHTAGAPVIEITGPTTAKAIWPVISFSRQAPTEANPGTWYYYQDTYERIDWQWKIKALRLTTELD